MAQTNAPGIGIGHAESDGGSESYWIVWAVLIGKPVVFETLDPSVSQRTGFDSASVALRHLRTIGQGR